MRTSFLLILWCCVMMASPLYSQVKGKITDSSGEPVPNAALYIREVTQGIMADNQGEFQINLKEGSYTFEFSSLGYERLSISVVVDKKPVTLAVELEKKTYSLPEVVVSSKREDPAYAVMRKAISMAPFYLHQIKRYESEVYLKGTIKVEKIPSILKIQAGGQSLKDIQNKLFLIESQNQVRFTAPNNYEQHVVAASSNLPEEIDVTDALDVITTNIYDPEAMGRISPLSAQAFSFYKFHLEGITFEGNHMVNKIRVTPKKKNPKLVSGWLYIIENSWNVQGADLAATEFGVTLRFTASYNEIKPYAFLPTAYDMDLKIDVMGVKATGKYYSSVQYKEVELNEEQGVIRSKTATRPVVAQEKTLTAKQQKAQQKIDKLNAKEELSNRDAYKMAKLMEEMVEPEERRKEKESLELLPGNTSLKLTVDSLAKKRDSLYWEEVRALPLRTEERESFKTLDSLKLLTDDQGQRVITASVGAGSSGDWWGGKQYQLGKKGYFRFNGLIGAVPEYNFVDGVWLGQRLTMGMNEKKYGFSLSPSVYYTTAREAINWQIDGNLYYAPLRNGYLSLSGGNTSTDFSKDGELRLLNSLSSLFFGENPIRFYQKRYIEAVNRIDIANGLVFMAGFSVEDRNALHNNLSYSIFSGPPHANTPNGQVIPMEDNRTTKYMAYLEYTPRHYYHLQGGRKRYAHSKFPTFALGYVRGISNRFSNYHLIDASIRQQIELNPFDYLNYTLSAGAFMDGHPGALPDFKHFRTSELFITGNALENSFSLLDNYQYSTNRRWLEAHLTYSTAYLLIKHIPFLQNYMFNESLHARTLWIPGKNHTELGYSIGIRNVGNIGLFAGFENGNYDGIGFTIAIPILREMGVR
ncbi:DUF5686 and carboxypeptidase regulatory-like domain-containing protein [Parabacteroides sp. PF5-6]|uniref:DUF5686 and carboxypeptidase regulatory-like domain-containing protein n=1 Tax=Parabacteroides sp. PF5-6 TaxID=1742403 RepID=UPI0024063594|nr:DUF5686 and carboxypeptidase regulatory-like domain-containing protein [Parabacteroides sp. PF5-6]MDF9830141.1 hypothetical protein [Parabacteroides sp. PF5-6]